MKIIIKILVLLVLSLSSMQINAQEEIETSQKEKIESLNAQKLSIENEERELLKVKVKAINQRLDKGVITQNEAERLKKEAAKKHALNIENRIAIIDNKMALLGRNSDRKLFNDSIAFGFRIPKESRVGKYFDKVTNLERNRRTSNHMVLAFGLNNAIAEGSTLNDSPYKTGGSRFFEIGWAWKTRVFKNAGFLRIKYGYSFQINGLKPTDNNYFVQQGNQTFLNQFEYNLRKSKLTITNLVFPVHLEFGPSKRIERKDSFRYTSDRQFRIGIGAYAGFNIGTRQKLKYTANGDKIKDKIKRSFNTTNLVYGLSGYVSLFDIGALYIKYDLSPLFKNQVVKQNNISLGIRFDMMD